MIGQQFTTVKSFIVQAPDEHLTVAHSRGRLLVLSTDIRVIIARDKHSSLFSEGKKKKFDNIVTRFAWLAAKACCC
jgi:hypothetical protein